MNKNIIIYLVILIVSIFFGCEKVISNLKESPEIQSFSYTPQVLILDSISGKIFDIDSTEVDSISLTAIFNISDSFNIIVNNQNLKSSEYQDTISINMSLSSLFTSAISYGDYKFPVTFITSAGDTAGDENISIIVNSEFIEPYYRYCWHLDNYDINFHSNYNIDTSANINVKDAWKISKGAGVIVAVIDDNFEKAHEDLAGNILEAYSVNKESDEVEDPNAYSSHGSTCASFIAAPENGIGVVGVAPEAKLLLIAESSYYDFNLLKAFDYAKEKGAKVISCSWGSYNVSASLTSKLQEMYEAGITVVFANGNDGIDLDNSGYDDESEVPWVLGIGASAEDNDYTTYTNYGSNIEVIAPGGDYVGVLGVDNTGDKGSVSQKNLVNNNYAFVNGTSFATPVTAGVVALMLSVDPTLTPDEVRTILIETADKVGGETADYVDGFDKYRAYGKVNAEKAVKRAAGLL